MKQLPQNLDDYPLDQITNWFGYSAKTDKTMLPQNVQVDPAQNCLIPNGDKLVPREGSQVVFQGTNTILDVGSVGKYTKFKNFFGVEMDVKAYREPTQGEQVYVLFNNVYVPITINPNTALNGTDKIYFSTYTDNNQDLSQSIQRLPRLIWVNGYATSDVAPKGKVFSWTGGISAITTIVANVITIPIGQTFRKLGFTVNFPNVTQIRVTINGVEFFSTNLAELDGNTLTLNANPTAIAGDIVTSAIEVDDLVAPMNHVKQNKNYAYYGNFNLRQWYMSNQYGRPSVIRITQSQAGQDDLIIPTGLSFTGTGQHTYKVTIDSVTPAKETRTFNGNGANTSYFVSTGYTGVGTNTYRMTIITDSVFTPVAGVGSFSAGEYIVGQTSGAVLKVINGGNFAGGACGTQWISGVPDTVGQENFIGTSSGVTRKIFAFLFQNEALLYKNGVQLTTLTGMSNFPPTAGVLQFAIVGNQILVPAELDGLQFVTTQIGANQIGDYYELTIQTQKPDTFQWTYDGAVQQTFVPITAATATLTYGGLIGTLNLNDKVSGNTSGAFGFIQSFNGTTIVLYGVVGNFQATEGITDITSGATATLSAATQTTSIQVLSQGVAIQFTSDIGHAIGDNWTITVNQAINRAWANFYYTLDLVSQQSIRRPGEGYIYDLASTFWTSDTFEDSIYVNTWVGDWGYTNPTLSADLLSEDISLVPLKQVISSRAKYPYLTGHNRNDLIYIDEKNNVVSMGRKELIQMVQSTPMTNDVLNKFQSLSFKNGSIIFQDNSINFTSPDDNTMMVFNERKAYWQPPQFIPNLGLLTIIDTDLYVHSSLDTATRRLNDPTAIGDDGVEYEVIARSPTYAHGDRVGRYIPFYHASRWNKKTANMAFWEGYVYAPMPKGSMKLNVYLDPDGCSGIKNTVIVPKYCCKDTNNGNFGGGNDGVHEFGGGVTDGCNYARYQWDDMGVVDFYFSSIEFRCRTTKHSYEILSMGINLAQSKLNNKEFRPTRDLETLLPLD